MPELVRDLEHLVAIPSIAFPGYPAEPVERMGQVTLDLFQKAGFRDARLMEVPSGYPRSTPSCRDRRARPSWSAHAHYACAGAARAGVDLGSVDPHPQGRRAHLRARAADDISGLIAHLGTMRVFDGQPPCTVKLILEGMEETESNLEAFVEAHPELFSCDLFIVCDMGNLRVGDPVFDRTSRRRRLHRQGEHPSTSLALRDLRGPLPTR